MSADDKTTPRSAAQVPAEQTQAEAKTAIRSVLDQLAATADRVGMQSTSRDIRETRIPKLESERFSIVILGEFNRGKSTFVNALLGEPVLPTGITPTTAVLTHIEHGAARAVEAVFESGARKTLAVDQLKAWVGGEAAPVSSETEASATTADPLHHVIVRHPAALLRDNITLVDTPGVNDINEQRAEITYGYLPRADAAVFLLDATQILTASERQFLEERILRSCRDRLLFVIAKADLLDPGELEETLTFARRHLATIVPDPVVVPVSARRALAGDEEGSGFKTFRVHLETAVGTGRRLLLLDHALGDARRLSGFVRQSVAMQRRSLELPLDELQTRIARAKERLADGRKALAQAVETVRSEAKGLRARVRQDLAEFARDFREALPAEIEAATAEDIRRYLSFFVQDTWKAWAEAESARIAEELERLAEQVIQVASENAREVAESVAGELGITDARIPLEVDTFKYDASVVALGAIGTTVFLFVNGLVGGLLTLAAPVVALLLRGKVAQEVKAEAQRRAPESVDRVAAVLGPKLDGLVDSFAQRLEDFIGEAGEALARGIAEVLDRAWQERRTLETADARQRALDELDAVLSSLKSVDERIAEIRQDVWR